MTTRPARLLQLQKEPISAERAGGSGGDHRDHRGSARPSPTPGRGSPGGWAGLSPQGPPPTPRQPNPDNGCYYARQRPRQTAPSCSASRYRPAPPRQTYRPYPEMGTQPPWEGPGEPGSSSGGGPAWHMALPRPDGYGPRCGPHPLPPACLPAATFAQAAPAQTLRGLGGKKPLPLPLAKAMLGEEGGGERGLNTVGPQGRAGSSCNHHCPATGWLARQALLDRRHAALLWPESPAGQGSAPRPPGASLDFSPIPGGRRGNRAQAAIGFPRDAPASPPPPPPPDLYTKADLDIPALLALPDRSSLSPTQLGEQNRSVGPAPMPSSERGGPAHQSAPPLRPPNFPAEVCARPGPGRDSGPTSGRREGGREEKSGEPEGRGRVAGEGGNA
ncbi:PREDICTED: proline-rich protein 2-like [Chrysochloris asiatica]|uniref:Proline-rich protein 2-like n=1 Tax=Chrysochloris asiatica TaxID=185453 RepID=A0A9B0X1C8_CHRAS|nr:PREDICTED: proline-rich protein 2-like [Chrysochloris asiatica]